MESRRVGVATTTGLSRTGCNEEPHSPTRCSRRQPADGPARDSAAHRSRVEWSSSWLPSLPPPSVSQLFVPDSSNTIGACHQGRQVPVRCANWSSSARGSMGALAAGATPSSSWPMPSCAPPVPSDRCPPSASSQSSAALTAVSTRRSIAAGSTRTDSERSSWLSARRSWPLVFAVDASTWDRCDAECSPERGFYYSASKHSAGQPIVAGWNYQWICQLDWAFDSWTAPLDMERIPPEHDAPRQRQNRSGGSFDSSQAKRKSRCSSSTLATTRSPSVTIWLKTVVNVSPASATTASFSPIPLLAPTDRRELADVLHGTDGGSSARIRSPGRRPSASLVASDPRYGTVKVKAWHGLHPRVIGRGRWADYGGAPPIVPGTVIRVEVERLPKPGSGTKKTLWLFWTGAGEPDLERCWRAYLRRFDIEHTFRFIKNTLGWTTPSLCTPEQADRWSWLIVGALTQLRLARGLVDDLRLPWERPLGPAKLTPTRVRRGFRRLRANDRYTSQSTEIDNTRTRTTQRDTKTAQKALSGGQEGCLSQWRGFNRKLRGRADR